MKSTKKAAPAPGRRTGTKMAVAGIAATGLAAGAAYIAYRRRRGTGDGMLAEETMLGVASVPPASRADPNELAGAEGVEVDAPEPMTESVAKLAHGVNDPQ
jgi:hypothetical protein